MISAVAVRAGLFWGEERKREERQGFDSRDFAQKTLLLFFCLLFFCCCCFFFFKKSDLWLSVFHFILFTCAIKPQQLMLVCHYYYWQLSSIEINLAHRNLSVPLWKCYLSLAHWTQLCKHGGTKCVECRRSVMQCRSFTWCENHKVYRSLCLIVCTISQETKGNVAVY